MKKYQLSEDDAKYLRPCIAGEWVGVTLVGINQAGAGLCEVYSRAGTIKNGFIVAKTFALAHEERIK